MTDNTTLNTLIEGYKEFHAHYFEKSTVYDQLLAEGQKPKAIVIACCDSRVDPAIVTGCQPGELFVVRNVANLVPPFDKNPQYHGTSAAIEFAVKVLKVSHIIIFGHSYCGGIQALMQTSLDKNTNGTPHDFIHAWMSIAEPAKQKTLQQHPNDSIEQQAHYCEQASLCTSLSNLKTFPWIQARVNDGSLLLHAWYFDLATGVITAYQPSSEAFVTLA
jgi:carbonic anhydrase